MISIEDCAALCGLDLDQIAAISEHEHVPEMEAAALANYLLHKKGGALAIREMIVDDIRGAMECADTLHACELLKALRHFLNQHPEAANSSLAN